MYEPPSLAARVLQHPMTRVVLAFIAGVVFVIAALALFRNDDNEIASEDTQAETTTTSAIAPSTTVVRRGIEGFEPIAFAVTTASGERRNWCGLLAQSEEQLNKGLMGQTDIGGYDGMIFRFAEDVQSAFYMANVPVPLDIAWFDAAGKFVSSTRMEVCTVDPNRCPRYNATAPYRYAIEVKADSMDEIGIGEGSSFGAGGPCS